tara:strand:+ start:48 stop:395 length:348 start_codon:yes stop_codon:yes gene_type:complete
MAKITNDWTGRITGSAYCDAASAITPPAGKVIMAIFFIKANILAALVSEDVDMYVNTVAASHEQDTATTNATDHGDGGLALSGASFPAGSTIYGRWTSVTPAAESDGGIIVYFGE